MILKEQQARQNQILEVHEERMPESQLQELFDFDEADLAANRNCILSTRQEKGINRAESRNSNLFTGLGLVSVLIIVVSAYNVVSRAVQRQDSLSNAPQSNIVGILVELGIPVLLFGVFAWGSFKLAAHRTSHTVQQVRGRINFVKTEKLFPEKNPNGSISYRTLEQYELHIGNIRFEDVNQTIMSILHNGDICSFYYLQDSKEVLSAELLAKA